jgi:hypothetical protein
LLCGVSLHLLGSSLQHSLHILRSQLLLAWRLHRTHCFTTGTLAISG